jgi:hypothetical protein
MIRGYNWVALLSLDTDSVAVGLYAYTNEGQCSNSWDEDNIFS